MGEVISLIKDVGLPIGLAVVLVLFFLKQYNKLADRMQSLEDFNRTELKGLTKEAYSALADNTTAMNYLTTSVTNLSRTLEK